MELQDWRKEPRKNYSNEFKLRMVELASQPGEPPRVSWRVFYL